MADINQVISLGIGTPADIPHFLTLGLSIGAAVVVLPGEMLSITMDVRTVSTQTVDLETRHRAFVNLTTRVES